MVTLAASAEINSASIFFRRLRMSIDGPRLNAGKEKPRAGLERSLRNKIDFPYEDFFKNRKT